MPVRTANAEWQGDLPSGKGRMKMESGAFDGQYSFSSRFEDGAGTNPEELIAAAHAGCFTMALSFALAKEGVTEARLETTARVTLVPEGEGFTVTRSDLQLTADVGGIDEGRLRELAEDAKKNCPISKLLKAEMGLTVNVGAAAEA